MTIQNLILLCTDQLLLWVMALLFLGPLLHHPQCGRWGVLVVLGCFTLRLTLLILAPGLQMLWIGQIINALFVFLLFRLCADLPQKSLAFCTIWVMILCQFSQQLSGTLYILLMHLSGLSAGLIVLLCLALTAAFYCLVGFTLARWMPEEGRYRIGPRQLLAAFLSFLVFEALAFIFRGIWHHGLDWQGWPLLLLMEVYCITLLYLQHEMFKKSALRHEIALLSQLHAQQRAQYDLAKENIALINRKCHDLKHQIKAMRLMSRGESGERYLQEMESAIRIYGAIVTTGNEVLDTVLTEKSLYCEAHSIQAHCVADGHLLDFMDPVDLYTIFGNALDNAIDGVKDLDRKEMRFIDVLVHRENQMLVIQIMNPMQQQLTFDEEGLPQSTKEKNGYHGFGLKSIRHTVSQYGGFVSVSVEDGCFCLRILLPLDSRK